MAVKQETRLEDQVFDFVRESEESVLEAGRKLSKTIGEFMPIEVPAVRDLVAGIFDFTGEVLKTQRDFARKVLDEARTTVEAAPKS